MLNPFTSKSPIETCFLSQVTCSDQREFQYPSKDVSLHFQVPANYGADIKVRDDANVDIRNLEGGPFDIIMDQGTCRVKNLRGSHLRVKTNGGSIECESQLLFEFGNLDTKKKGKISVKKLQGKEFCLETENGAIDVGASYVLKAQLSSESGHINLGDIHGEYTMHLLGNTWLQNPDQGHCIASLSKLLYSLFVFLLSEE